MSHTHVMLEHRRVEREQAAAQATPALPPVLLAATPVDVDEAWLPGGPKSIYRAALKAGWTARITKACGPWLDADGGVDNPETYTVCVAAQSPAGTRLVFHWRWRPGPAKWDAEDCQDGRTGRMMKITEGKRLLT